VLVADRQAGVRATIQGFATGAYRFEVYRSSNGQQATMREVCLLGRPDWPGDQIREVIRVAATTEHAVTWARDLVNTPARDLTPAQLADRALGMAEACALRAKVWCREELEAGQFGGILGVSAGSRHEPRLVELRYDPPGGARRVIGLAGKGITFDSGGLALKKCDDMFEMKSDMAGAAAVLATMRVIADLKPAEVGVVAAVPLAENMPGSGAIRPGDVLRHRNGATTEVSDPDAEGRLVLADALAYLVEQQPDAIIDAATLTYSCIAALGLEITAGIGNDAALLAAVKAAGEAVGEPVWELPLWRRYRRQLDSDVADLRNEAKEDLAGAIVAALFMESFVGETPWVHLDIGGTAFLDEATDDVPAGGTGVLVRTFVHLLTGPADGSGSAAQLLEKERVP
jgi:leucyl aminopeptidase